MIQDDCWLEYFFDAVYQFLRTKRLGDVVIHFCDMQAKDFINVLRFGGDNDDRDIARGFIGFHLLVYFPPVHVRHH